MVNGIISEFDSKDVMKVRIRFGAEGYLAYIAIQELLYRNINHALERNYESIASEICVSVSVVKGVIEELDLFVLSDTHFTSISINMYFESRRKISESKAKGGYARWGKKIEANADINKANVCLENAYAQQEKANDNGNITNAQKGNAYAKTKQADAQKAESNAQNEKRKEAKENSLFSDIKSNDFSLLGECAHTCEEKPKRKRQSDKDPEVVRLNREAKETFMSVYHERFGNPYVWGAADAGQMTNLLSYIRVSRSERKNPLPIDTDSMLGALKEFLLAINDYWVLRHFSVKVIASKYNEIISSLKEQKQKPSHYENNSNREKDRRGTVVDESFKDLDYEEGF